MSTSSLLDEDGLRPLVAYSPSSDEEMVEAVVNAFLTAGIDVFRKPTPLVDWSTNVTAAAVVHPRAGIVHPSHGSVVNPGLEPTPRA